ncbi:hypothetical protein GH733_015982 [Mirounga leonina]|nr:hypothetical protein GH733_015982 [Mirounga leonina]
MLGIPVEHLVEGSRKCVAELGPEAVEAMGAVKALLDCEVHEGRDVSALHTASSTQAQHWAPRLPRRPPPSARDAAPAPALLGALQAKVPEDRLRTAGRHLLAQVAALGRLLFYRGRTSNWCWTSGAKDSETQNPDHQDYSNHLLNHISLARNPSRNITQQASCTVGVKSGEERPGADGGSGESAYACHQSVRSTTAVTVKEEVTGVR